MTDHQTIDPDGVPFGERLLDPGTQDVLSCLYGTDPDVLRQQTERIADMSDCLDNLAPSDERIRVFSAPGRTEIGGNHTDHQGGNVLCAAIRHDITAVVRRVSEPVVRLTSEGFKSTIRIDLRQLDPVQRETGHSASLIRGIASRLQSLGYRIGGFDAYTTSRIPRGSGLSSSAAFELLVAEIFNGLYNKNAIPVVEKAQAAQYAENVFYGKPCGLMDQMACASGGITAIDFTDPLNPEVRKIAEGLDPAWPALVVTHTGGSHATLSGQYASIPIEMRLVATQFGAERLRDVPPSTFYENIPHLIRNMPGRPLVRAMHFFDETERAILEAASLEKGDLKAFLALVNASGKSSWTLLQNVYVADNPDEQNLGLGLALSERILQGRGAVRVHGGGFAGTMQAFVPRDLLPLYMREMRMCFGQDSAVELSVRPFGAREVVLP